MEETRVERDLAGEILRVIDRSGPALSVRELARLLQVDKKKRPALDRGVSDLLAEGRIHVWPGSRYGARPFLDAAAGDVLQILLKKAPLPKAALKARLSKVVKPYLDSILVPLLDDGKIFIHPKGPKRPMAFGLTPPDPLEYLEPAVRKTLAPYLKLFGDAQIARALARLAGALSRGAAGTESSPEAASREAPARLLLGLLHEVNPQVSGGALVFITDWRKAAAALYPEKRDFDSAVIALAEEGTIQLQSHDRPADLLEEEKQSLIPNGRGSYFIAAGLRM